MIKRVLLTLMVLLATSPLMAATITIINKDAAGVGFNDPTPAVPVGGNNGTTLGQQRLNVFQYAAGIWGAKLNSPITIKIAANFSPLGPCSPTSGVIGSAGPTTFLRDFANAPRANTFYPVAQASALAGTDFAVQFGIPDGASISASFNSIVGTAGCLSGTSFYLGLDANEGSQIDLAATLLHEFGHGLGFSGITDLGTGTFFDNRPDIFAVFTHDNSLNMNWHVMSAAQRLTSTTNTANVVFDGTNTVAAATLLAGGGTDNLGTTHRPKLFTPNPQQGGSSVFHFDTSANPNQLMEPAINHSLTHNVDVPDDLTTKAFQDMGWPLLSAAPAAPTGVVAGATAATAVTVTWTASAGATSYNVYRSAFNNRNSFTQIATGIVSTMFNDTGATGLAANRSYLYKVRATNGTESADSNSDLTTTVIFTDPSLSGIAIKAAHFNELRTAADSLRALAGLGLGNYATDSGTLTSAIACKAAHVNEIRTELNAARTILGLGNAGVSVTIGGFINATDITALRAAVQ